MTLQVSAETIGALVTCPTCVTEMTVPTPEEEAAYIEEKKAIEHRAELEAQRKKDRELERAREEAQRKKAEKQEREEAEREEAEREEAEREEASARRERESSRFRHAYARDEVMDAVEASGREAPPWVSVLAGLGGILIALAVVTFIAGVVTALKMKEYGIYPFLIGLGVALQLFWTGCFSLVFCSVAENVFRTSQKLDALKPTDSQK